IVGGLPAVAAWRVRPAPRRRRALRYRGTGRPRLRRAAAVRRCTNKPSGPGLMPPIGKPAQKDVHQTTVASGGSSSDGLHGQRLLSEELDRSARPEKAWFRDAGIGEAAA